MTEALYKTDKFTIHTDIKWRQLPFVVSCNQEKGFQMYISTYHVVRTEFRLKTLFSDFCPTCRNNRLLSDAEDSRQYVSAAIFVSKAAPVVEILKDKVGTLEEGEVINISDICTEEEIKRIQEVMIKAFIC